eukprot:3658606-Rhodomonas_salina.2
MPGPATSARAQQHSAAGSSKASTHLDHAVHVEHAQHARRRPALSSQQRASVQHSVHGHQTQHCLAHNPTATNF